MDDTLENKLADVLIANHGNDDLQAIVDAILAIPEIAEALRPDCEVCGNTGSWVGNSSNHEPVSRRYECPMCGRKSKVGTLNLVQHLY